MDSLPRHLELLRSVLSAISLGTIVLDPERRVVLWNAWMAQHSGHPAELMLGRDLFETYPDMVGKRIEVAVRQALHDNFRSLLSQTLHKAPLPLYSDAAARARDERIQQAVSVTPLSVDGGVRHCLIQISDVSVAVGRERQLREQAMVLRSQTFSDGLTGIANRRHFDMAIEKELRRSKRTGAALSLLMIDIDYFKAYNDHYGHQLGDECLIKVADTLSKLLQRPTDLIARYGGEEFAVILPDTDASHAVSVAEMMRAKMVELAIAHVDSASARHVTVSIGIATRCPQHAVEVPQLIGSADRALYAAKRAGRNKVIVAELAPA